jgi:Ca2+-binding RTX toxin-like protein
MAPIRIEAEDMNLVGYDIELGSFASGGELIRLAGSSGSAIATFSDLSGIYDVVVGYYDENDGLSQLTVSMNNTQPPLSSWTLDQNLGSSRPNAQTFQERVVATNLTITSGATFTIEGIQNLGENARLDYIEFRPISSSNTNPPINGTNSSETLSGDGLNNVINGLGGDDTLNGNGGDDTLAGGGGHDQLNGGNGIDTADYSQTGNGIVANLQQGTVFAPIFGTNAQPKLMPLGDSITAGQHSVNPVPGAYRIELWDDFLGDNFNVNFVGSQLNGPSSLGDKDHEGRPGWTITQIKDLVNTGILNTYQPDVVMLMIGTNDSSKSSVSTMTSNLSTLIDRITTLAPNTHLVVSSIAPIDGTIKGTKRAQRAKDFNTQLPGLISSKASEGKKVTYANAGGSLSVSDLTTDGLHPSASGYDKLGDAWYKALVEKDTLSSIENVVGTAYKDTLTGTSGANALEGSGGNDSLTGGGGADTFVYKSTSAGGDTITDFSNDDLFRISASGFGGGLVSGVSLSNGTASSTGVFVLGNTSIGTAANFLYSNGALKFDVDGTGSQAAVTIATLSNSPTLSASQLTIVA